MHSDQDKGDGTLKYVLSGDGAGSLFLIDENSGDIHATKRLDREEKAYYTLRAQAVNKRTGRPVEPESQFVIKIHDINDNEPKFTKDTYIASVPEMSDVGTPVVQVTATDDDDATYGNSARVVYSILQGQPYFSVEPDTGIIRTALANMNRENKGKYQVVIQAKDMAGQIGGLSGTTTVNISLSDVNDNPPRFPQGTYQFSTPESTEVGSPVGRIKANDADVGENAEVKYNIIGGDGVDMFDIMTDKDTQEGVITVKRPLDYERKKIYTIKVQTENTHLDPRFLLLGPFKDTATVKITVEDVDEPPVFERASYVMEVKEDASIGTLMGSVIAADPDATKSLVRIKANDADVGENAEVKYNIIGGDGVDMFDIMTDKDTQEGVITVKRPLDYERKKIYTIKVQAENTHLDPRFLLHGPFKDTATVKITVEDVDEPPVFERTNYVMEVKEDASIGTLIGSVIAADPDATKSLVRYSIDRLTDLDRMFNIHSGNGSIVTFKHLDRESFLWHNITVTATEINNIVSYNDEGGGEEDTQAFDIGTLRNPEAMDDNKLRRDIIPETLFPSRRTAPTRDNADVRDFINQRLQENDTDPTAPPYDSLATYAYEGNGSIAESLSSLESATIEGDQDYNYLSEWGPRFKKLADMYGGEDSDKDS
ncbi:UNVERIFIED_CONTAM: hypothetical protein FKN15_032845 [Acipenser sinensis]